MVGTVYGRHRLIGQKSWEGAMANFAVSTLATLIVATTLFAMPADRAIGLALVGGLISVLAELCPFPIDDNFSIPVLSASALYVIMPLI